MTSINLVRGHAASPINQAIPRTLGFTHEGQRIADGQQRGGVEVEVQVLLTGQPHIPAGRAGAQQQALSRGTTSEQGLGCCVQLV